MVKKVCIVGSGIAGISAAIRLAQAGFSVEVYEANSYPGGKLSLLNTGKYCFDAGPSLFTMPQFVEELFQINHLNPKDYFEYYTCKTTCRYFFEDGTFLPLSSNRQEMLNTIRQVLEIDTQALEKHLAQSAYIYKKTHKVFLERSLHKVDLRFSKDILTTIAAIPYLGLFTSMHNLNKKNLNHPKLIQLFDRYATYNGSNPYKAPGILNIIPHLEFGIGTYFPKHGMNDITVQLVRLAEKIGVKFHYNSPVQEIIEDGKEIHGIKVNDIVIKSDLVFCNADVKPAYKYLLKNTKAKKKTLTQEPSSSAMIFYWGIKQSFENLDLHNIFFSEDYENEFTTIFEKKDVCDDPTVYIHISSKYVKEYAPKGCENWFVMVNVPSNSGQNWDELRIRIRKNILIKLSRLLKTDIESLIEEEDYIDPIRIEQRTSSHAGALYGASSNDRNAAFFRHPNFSKVRGLYFVGGSVHPGGGIPLCLLSAKIASEIATQDFS